MKEFSSKLALNQAILEKNKAIEAGEIVVIKTFSNVSGEHERKYLMKKCNKCGELFFQSEKCKYVYVLCDKCSKAKPVKDSFGNVLAITLILLTLSLLLFGCTAPLTMTKKTSSENSCRTNAEHDFLVACAKTDLNNCSGIWDHTKVTYNALTQDCTMQIPIEVNATIKRVV
jgi:hypothetical protein